MENKRGQVTIFIIIAIIIIVLGILIYMFYPQIKTNFVSKENSISLFVRSCIDDTGKDAVYYISQKGGYFISPEFSTSEGVAFYYFNRENYMPPQDIIEEQISIYMNSMLAFCMQDFVNFPEFNVSQGEIETRTRIKEGEVVFDVKFPLTIRKGESVTRVEDFENIKIPVRLNLIYNSIEEIIENQIGNENICLSCISEIASRNELKIDMNNLENGIVFSVTDENSYIKDVPLEFKFANKYTE